MDVEGMRSRLEAAGQAHLLQFWEGLGEEERQRLWRDLSSIHFEEVNGYFRDAQTTLQTAATKVDSHMEPPPPNTCGSVSRADPETLANYNKLGLTAMGHNRVAVLLLAGGQGTRLGVNYPKGMYDVGLPSGKTLYQLQAERIVGLQRQAAAMTGQDCCVPWYIMTSQHTKQATQAFFTKHNHFGLQPQNVVLFEQGRLPCLTFDGKIILETGSKVALAPDGNGGLYRALKRHGVLADMERRGTQYVHVYCVDNILVRMADPVFIGFCLEKKAECGAKVVEKTAPQEAVGVVCKVRGHYQVVEYSEITLSTAEKRAPDGRLAFNAANTCNHFFTLDFLRQVCRSAGKRHTCNHFFTLDFLRRLQVRDNTCSHFFTLDFLRQVCSDDQERQLKHHVARKKIAHVDASGSTVKPSSPNGIKMEKFVFDVFQFATNFAVWDVLREEEFSPLKNADGAAKDTPTTCRNDLCALHRRYALAAGAVFVHADGSPYPDIQSRQQSEPANGQSSHDTEEAVVCEISPLVSYAGEGLESLKGKKLCPPVVVETSPDNGLDIQVEGTEGSLQLVTGVLWLWSLHLLTCPLTYGYGPSSVFSHADRLLPMLEVCSVCCPCWKWRCAQWTADDCGHCRLSSMLGTVIHDGGVLSGHCRQCAQWTADDWSLQTVVHDGGVLSGHCRQCAQWTADDCGHCRLSSMMEVCSVVTADSVLSGRQMTVVTADCRP
ncbi:hypothetical protein ACOMHN_001320 [Nucella lapillus]